MSSIGTTGLYHADSGDAPAVKVSDGGLDDDGNPTDNLVVFSNGSHGSGLDGGANVRSNVKRTDKGGGWSPAS